MGSAVTNNESNTVPLWTEIENNDNHEVQIKSV